MSICLAIDIGGTKIAAALVDMKAKQPVILERSKIKTPKSQSEEDLVLALQTLLQPMKGKADFVAVASTGIINNGVLTALNPDNLGGLNKFELVNHIETIIKLPTYALNDAQAATWCEYENLSASQNINNMAFITISTGIGGGLVIDGRLQTGARGISGHFGHSVVDVNGPLCGCGRQGCIEKIASGSAIGIAGRAVFNRECSGKDVYELAIEGNQEATKIVKHSAKAVAELIANLTISLDLDAVVIGGSIGLAPNYHKYLENYLNEKPLFYRPTLITAQSGADAGLLGAASWFLAQQTI